MYASLHSCTVIINSECRYVSYFILGLITASNATTIKDDTGILAVLLWDGSVCQWCCRGVALIRGARVLQGVLPLIRGCICRNEGRKKALHKCRALSGWNGLWLVGSGFFDALTFKPFEEISLLFGVLTRGDNLAAMRFFQQRRADL